MLLLVIRPTSHHNPCPEGVMIEYKAGINDLNWAYLLLAIQCRGAFITPRHELCECRFEWILSLSHYHRCRLILLLVAAIDRSRRRAVTQLTRFQITISDHRSLVSFSDADEWRVDQWKKFNSVIFYYSSRSPFSLSSPLKRHLL